MAKKTVSASIVRQWAKNNIALLEPEAQVCLSDTARGRLHKDVVALFNREHKNAKYDSSLKVPNPESLIVQTITVTTESGRKVPRKVTMTLSEVRSLTGTVGTRGRIPTALKVAAAEAKVAAAV